MGVQGSRAPGWGGHRRCLVGKASRPPWSRGCVCRQKGGEVRAEAWAGCWEGREAGQASGQGLLGAEGIPSITLYLFETEKML